MKEQMIRKKTGAVLPIVILITVMLMGMMFNINAQSYFIDENGDGFNDNAPDHDDDGIPNRIDPDFRRMTDMENSPFWTQLSDEQQTELQALITFMQNNGASPEEIQTSVTDKLSEWGIDMPANFGRGMALNNQQRRQVREMIRMMQNQGASREDIRSAVSNQLGEWGIDAPVRGPMASPRQGQNGRHRGQRP